MTETIYRCPSCKARVELSDTVCSICGESLTPTALVRTSGTVKQLTRRATSETPSHEVGSHEAAPQTSNDLSEMAADAMRWQQLMPPGASQSAPPLMTQPSPAPEPAHLPFDTQQIPSDVAYEPWVTPAPTRSSAGPRPVSGSSLGWMMLCAVVVLSMALLIGIRLAQETTTEVRASVVDTPSAATPLPQIAASISSNRINTGPESTVIAQGTEVAESWAAIQAKATRSAQLTPASPALSSAATTTATELTQPPLKWQLELASARYETSGRPAQNCGRFKADDPVRKFTFTLKVTNNTGADLDAKGWGAVAYVGEQPAAQLCYFKTEGPQVPALLQGQTQQVTLSAFVEPDQRISKIVIGDNLGNATRICVKDTRVVNCDAA